VTTVDDHHTGPQDHDTELGRLRRENSRLRAQVEQMRETGRALAEIELAHLDEIERLHGRAAQLEAGQAGATPPAGA
jgi:hypothetical protein